MFETKQMSGAGLVSLMYGQMRLAEYVSKNKYPIWLEFLKQNNPKEYNNRIKADGNIYERIMRHYDTYWNLQLNRK